MNPHTFIGCAVTVILREGSYHGTIHRFDSLDKRITLRDVSNPVNGNKYPGIRHFYASEILDMVMDDDYDESLIDSPPCAVIQTNEVPAYEDFGPVCPDETDDASPPTKNVIPESPPAKSCDRYTIIDEFNDQFQDIMSFIQEQMMIGFHLVSIGEGRHGKICWIAISVEDHAYLFDFLALGNNLFKNGMQDILESTKITKIIHDCRFISDLLFHKYSVNLAKVFDTQVADAFVHRAWYGVGHRNHWPKFVQPLSVCLFSHLKLSTEEIAGISAREGKTKVEQDLWPQRPLNVPLAETLICSVKYLDELRRLLLEKMMIEYMAGVDIYLGSVKNLPESEVSWYSSKSEYLPKTFNNMNRFTQVLKDSFKNRERESSTFSPFEISRGKKVPSRKGKNSRSHPTYEPVSPVANLENTEMNESPIKAKEQPILKDDLEESTFSFNEPITISGRKSKNSRSHPTYEPVSPVANLENTGVPSLPLSPSGNKSSPGTCPSINEDIFIQAARKMLPTDIPADLMDLLKIPAKYSSAATETKPDIFNKPDTSTTSEDSSSPSKQTGVEWSRYRTNGQNKLTLLPAGCSMTENQKKKTKQSSNHQSHPQRGPPNSFQQSNIENKNPIHRDSMCRTPQNRNSEDMTDTFFEIPDSDSFTRDLNVLGQIQTYSVSKVPFHQTANYVESFSGNNDTNNNSINSPPHNRTEQKSPLSGSAKANHSSRSSSRGSSSRESSSPSRSRESSSSGVPAEVQIEGNRAGRNYWVNGNGVGGNGVVGNGGMTHIERLMAVWRNNCK